MNYYHFETHEHLKHLKEGTVFEDSHGQELFYISDIKCICTIEHQSGDRTTIDMQSLIDLLHIGAFEIRDYEKQKLLDGMEDGES